MPVGRTREIAIAGLTALFVWFVASPVLAVAVFVLIVTLSRSLRTWRVQRSATRLDRELLPFVEELGRNLRSGSTSIESLRCAAEKYQSHNAFASLVRIAQTGTGAAEALVQWKPSVPTATADHVRQLLHFGEVVGGLRPQFVDGIASSLRESNQLVAEIRVLSDQAKYSAILMSLAPLLFAVALVATDRASPTLSPPHVNWWCAPHRRCWARRRWPRLDASARTPSECFRMSASRPSYPT